MVMAEDRSEKGPTVGAARPEGSEKKSFFERNQARLRLIAAAGILGAAAAGVSGHPKLGAGGGLEVTNPFNGESVRVGVVLATHNDALLAGLPEKELNSLGEMNQRALSVKIGSANFIVWTGIGPEKNSKQLTIRVFTAAGTEEPDIK